MSDGRLQMFDTDNHSDSVDKKLKHLLSSIRKHLGMEVAFISEFVGGRRVFRFVDAENVVSPIKAGDSDPLDETYCKKIVDNELDNIILDTHRNNITNHLAVTNTLSIGSYIGVPLLLSNGETYGTFCCYKQLPDQSLNQRDLSFLKAVADIAGNLIETNITAVAAYRVAEGRIRSVLLPDKIKIHYQPIYNLAPHRIAGYESLSRFDTEPYRTPDVWFSEASQVGLGEALEMLAIEQAVGGLGEFDDGVYISVNVSPEYVLNGAISRVLDRVDARRIVLEVTEHSPINNYAAFRQALEPFRKRGARLAIDDAGAGYSSFKHVLELEADIIKLDISLTQNIHCDQRKFMLGKALCAFAKAVNCTIIAEGIETAEELSALKELGVDKAQGYFLGRPMPIKEAASHSRFP